MTNEWLSQARALVLNLETTAEDFAIADASAKVGPYAKLKEARRALMAHIESGSGTAPASPAAPTHDEKLAAYSRCGEQWMRTLRHLDDCPEAIRQAAAEPNPLTTESPT